MAKILVADDNSNIQKMVGLALKDQGIDVVAVGNGEAAVRKISDLKPDLVLADVFMPVRNGYEVCKYVKSDSALAHIPVILLVGAFDPLDEQEAQRVGADGVLKKPFVPPDPLISMVKSALVRAAAGQVAAMTPDKTTTPTAAETSAVPTVAAMPDQLAHTQKLPTVIEDVPPRPAAVKIESANQPLAFGSLLETPPVESEDDSAFIPPSKELLDRDWSAPAEDEEEEEEEESTDSWRRDGGNEAIAQQVESANEQASAPRKKREPWTPTREKQQDLVEADEMPEFVTSPAPSPGKSSAVSIADEKKGVSETARPAASAPPAPVSVDAANGADRSQPKETGKQPAEATAWFSVSSSPWEAEAKKASELASTWDVAPASPASPVEPATPMASEPPEAPVVEPPPSEPDISYDFVSEEPSNEPVVYTPDPALVGNETVSNDRLPELISDEELPAAAVETIRQETSFALEDAARQAQEASAVGVPEKPAEEAVDMDALVAKVLAKMSPEMLQAVTREILKPVVQAMIREEVKAKK